jgi:hypothetical protein
MQKPQAPAAEMTNVFSPEFTREVQPDNEPVLPTHVSVAPLQGTHVAPLQGTHVAPQPGALHTAVWCMAFAAAIILLLAVVWSMCNFLAAGPARGGPMAHALAKQLAHRGWVAYYLRGCGHCTKQRSILGGAPHVHFECDRSGAVLGRPAGHPPIACNSPQITGYPYWYNAKTREGRAGVQTLKSLEQMARW